MEVLQQLNCSNFGWIILECVWFRIKYGDLVPTICLFYVTIARIHFTMCVHKGLIFWVWECTEMPQSIWVIIMNGKIKLDILGVTIWRTHFTLWVSQLQECIILPLSINDWYFGCFHTFLEKLRMYKNVPFNMGKNYEW